MKKIKQFTSIFMACAMAATTLVGCAAKDVSAPSSTASAGSTATNAEFSYPMKSGDGLS